MFSAFQTFGKLGALASSVARAWPPLALWPDGIDSPGMWISPRDLTSQWADYTGTTPVATPGTVADSSNPVGLALDIRAGAPEVLGAELVDNLAPAAGQAALIGTNTYEVLSAPAYVFPWSAIGQVINKTYLVNGTVSSLSSGSFVIFLNGVSVSVSSNGDYSFRLTTTNSNAEFNCFSSANIGAVISFFVREVPGNHMLQSTSTSRPLLSAYDGQTLGPGDTYDGTGYPVFQLYDGVDDGMATAAFTAGTLINGMDCMIAVRRDSAAATYLISDTGSRGFFEWESGDTNRPDVSAGTPTYYVDGVACTATRGALFTALTAGDWHILEARGLDLSTWTALEVSSLASYRLNGARGDIMLFPSTTPTEDKDAARQWLADYYGVTLP